MISRVQATSAGGAPTTSPSDQKLKDSVKALEGVFVQQLYKAMRDTVPQQDGIVSGGAGEDIFTGLLDEHIAAETPEQWERGLSESLYRQLRGRSASTAAQASPSSPASPTA